MKTYISARTAAFLLAFALPLAGCGGPDPEKAGDECDPDDGCPNGMVCAKGGDDNICYLPLGAQCDAAGPDYCLDNAVCGTSATSGQSVCGIGEGGECDPAAPMCAGNLTCAELSAGGNKCYPPVLATGMVFDSESAAAIEGAEVLALDDQASAITDIAMTDAAGNYSLDVPVPRNDDGSPVTDMIFTLRASARDYQTFPGGIRTALPISTSEAVAGDAGWTIQTALTDVAMIAVAMDQRGLPSISGTVLADEMSGGVLVVAEDGAGVGRSAITDKSGAYTIFNVPMGSHAVQGYAAGVQLEPATADVAGADLTGIDLARSEAALGTISGSVNIVNAPGGSVTSVVLVVESTFNDTFVRGDVGRGLRTPLSGPPSISGAFTIPDVPEGRYVVLAAFENDDLVRDPDPNIAGTQIVTVDMPSPGQEVALADSFKITEALRVLGPGVDDPEAVTSPPTLTWADDSSEDFYTVVVYNAYGELVWCLADPGLLPNDPMCDGGNIPGVSGGGDVTVPYGGPLEPGMYYQFRAMSWRSPGGNPGPISATEDLRGVFYMSSAM